MAVNARVAAARTVAEVLSGRSLNQALPPWQGRVSPRDRGLLQQLCYGTLRESPRLLAYLDQLLDKPLRDKDRDVQALLLCGLYQLENTRIPDHAAVSETVAATGKLKKSWATGLSNAVLRRFLRERDTLQAGLDEAAALAHPRWLLDAVRAQWPEQAEQLIAANNTQPPMTLRVNALCGSRDAYLLRLADAGVEARPGTLGPMAVYLDQPCDVADLPGFADGLVSVQDEAAQLAAPLLQLRPGQRVLDACAAPGGKTGHILELEPALECVVAMDLDPARLTRVEDNLERLGLCAQLLAGDGAAPPEALVPGSFDRILVDAPCSASGVIRRHPDVKLLRRATDIDSFARQQLSILSGLWPLLKPGGRLLYATCSVLEAENSATVKAFLAAQDDGLPLPLEAEWGELAQPGRQLLPQPAGPDGLYYALLEKQSAR